MWFYRDDVEICNERLLRVKSIMMGIYRENREYSFGVGRGALFSMYMCRGNLLQSYHV